MTSSGCGAGDELKFACTDWSAPSFYRVTEKNTFIDVDDMEPQEADTFVPRGVKLSRRSATDTSIRYNDCAAVVSSVVDCCLRDPCDDDDFGDEDPANIPGGNAAGRMGCSLGVEDRFHALLAAEAQCLRMPSPNSLRVNDEAAYPANVTTNPQEGAADSSPKRGVKLLRRSITEASTNASFTSLDGSGLATTQLNRHNDVDDDQKFDDPITYKEGGDAPPARGIKLTRRSVTDSSSTHVSFCGLDSGLAETGLSGSSTTTDDDVDPPAAYKAKEGPPSRGVKLTRRSDTNTSIRSANSCWSAPGDDEFDLPWGCEEQRATLPGTRLAPPMTEASTQVATPEGGARGPVPGGCPPRDDDKLNAPPPNEAPSNATQADGRAHRGAKLSRKSASHASIQCSDGRGGNVKEVAERRCNSVTADNLRQTLPTKVWPASMASRSSFRVVEKHTFLNVERTGPQEPGGPEDFGTHPFRGIKLSRKSGTDPSIHYDDREGRARAVGRWCASGNDDDFNPLLAGEAIPDVLQTNHDSSNPLPQHAPVWLQLRGPPSNCCYVMLPLQTDQPHCGTVEEAKGVQGRPAKVRPPPRPPNDEEAAAKRLTTVMFRNLPNEYDNEMLGRLLHANDVNCDFAYLPADFRSKCGLGYAFVNCVTHADASAAKAKLHGYRDWEVPSNKVCSACWGSLEFQGLAANIERYRNSPVMHERVDDRFQPALYEGGKRVPFPAPDKKIRKPRKRGVPPDPNSNEP